MNLFKELTQRELSYGKALPPCVVLGPERTVTSSDK